MKPKVIIYSKIPCPYCVRAKRFLEERKIDFQEIDLTGQYDRMSEIKEETGWQSFPIIIINDQLIGGYDDMRALDDAGELNKLLGI